MSELLDHKRMEKVRSPLTNSSNTKIVRVFSTSEIIRDYKKLFGIDTSYIFQEKSQIIEYLCCDTGYKFFYPLNISGDDKFYSALSKAEWYYCPWRWEHEQSLKYISEGNRVLEIGAGKGYFLKKTSESIKNVECFGLELNSHAVESGMNEKLRIKNESVEAHALANFKQYDIVFAFQVLEHISDVHSFLSSSLKCLKNGGKLIISVPNNQSFMKDNTLPTYVLNTPPHHMGLWDAESLSGIARLFDIKLEGFFIEPLQPASYSTYQYTRIKKVFFQKDFFAWQYWKLHCKLGLQSVVNQIIHLRSKKIIGHTIMAVYTK